jgi:hypothetical protein
MKKRVLGLVAVAAMLLQSCEEKGVAIDFGGDGTATDTTYVAPVETPQSRNVLIEEFTGASCTNCPAGHQTVDAIVTAHPDNVVAIAYHTFLGGTVFKPVDDGAEKSTYDFRTTLGTDIATNIFNVNSIPVAGVDRVPQGTDMAPLRIYWASQTDARLAVTTPLNLHLSAAYSSADNEVTVKVKVAYTKDVSKKQVLMLGVIESGIVDAQKYPDHVDMEYVHNHVVRSVLTPQYYGIGILDNMATKPAGQVYEYNFKFKPDATWKLANCKLYAFVSNNESDSKEVAQAVEVDIK